MNYDVTEHSILSDKAKQLVLEDTLKFVANVEMAEALLGVPEDVPTNAKVLARLQLAVGLQVNYQVQMGVDPLYIKSSGSQHAGNSVTYRDSYVDPRAQQIVAMALGLNGLAARYGAKITSVRTQGFATRHTPVIRDVIP